MKVRKMARCALFAALLTLCAWLCVPVGDSAFTMQTFGVFLALGLLGGKWGTVSILVYLLLGAAGAPVFSGFRGGVGALAGITGGYLVGFLFSGLIYWFITYLGKNTKKSQLLAMVSGLLGCYLFGTIWFYFCYLQGGSTAGLGFILLKCVVPYVLPDAVKLALAFWLTQRLKRFVA